MSKEVKKTVSGRRTRKDIQQTLERLRQKYQEHYNSIQGQITSLRSQNQFTDTERKIFASNLSKLRAKKTYTYQMVGSFCGLSHTAIEKLEAGRIAVDCDYIEVFSLIYQVAPFYLIGRIDNPAYTGDGIKPMDDFVGDSVKKARFILCSLYHDNRLLESNFDLLKFYLKVCDAKNDYRKNCWICFLTLRE